MSSHSIINEEIAISVYWQNSRICSIFTLCPDRFSLYIFFILASIRVKMSLLASQCGELYLYLYWLKKKRVQRTIPSVLTTVRMSFWTISQVLMKNISARTILRTCQLIKQLRKILCTIVSVMIHPEVLVGSSTYQGKDHSYGVTWNFVYYDCWFYS